ncbi:MAG: hypothetical protein ABH950_10265 [Candidatus Altiarchaeota archaeon]
MEEKKTVYTCQNCTQWVSINTYFGKCTNQEKISGTTSYCQQYNPKFQIQKSPLSSENINSN